MDREVNPVPEEEAFDDDWGEGLDSEDVFSCGEDPEASAGSAATLAASAVEVCGQVRRKAPTSLSTVGDSREQRRDVLYMTKSSGQPGSEMSLQSVLVWLPDSSVDGNAMSSDIEDNLGMVCSWGLVARLRHSSASPTGLTSISMYPSFEVESTVLFFGT